MTKFGKASATDTAAVIAQGCGAGLDRTLGKALKTYLDGTRAASTALATRMDGLAKTAIDTLATNLETKLNCKAEAATSNRIKNPIVTACASVKALAVRSSPLEIFYDIYSFLGGLRGSVGQRAGMASSFNLRK